MSRRRNRFLAWGVIALCGAAAAHAVPLKVTPPKLEVAEHRLGNGLRVLMNEDHSVPIVTVQLWYHVGSKNERAGRSGFAHLFEHLMFKGSRNVGLEEHKDFIQSIGGSYNATTDFDRTLYFETIPSNYLERILWMEADRMETLNVSEENFLSERQVVKEERRMRIDDPPFGRMFENVFANTYQTHPYRILPIGSMKDLDAATVDDVRDFYKTYYVPNNATLVLSGDFEPKQVLQWVEKYFGDIPAGKPIARNAPQEAAQTKEKRAVVYDSKAPLPAVVLAYHVPAASDPDVYPLQVASNILSAGQSSRLYRKMVYEQQLALQASGQTYVLEDPGAFFFFSILQGGHKPEEGEKALLEEVERLKSEPVSAEELEKARNQFIADMVFDRQTVMSKATAIGYSAVIQNDLSLLNRELAEFQKVTAADIQRVAKKYMSPENRTVIYMLPESMKPDANGTPAAGGTGAGADSSPKSDEVTR
jgi:zinc protease